MHPLSTIPWIADVARAGEILQFWNPEILASWVQLRSIRTSVFQLFSFSVSRGCRPDENLAPTRPGVTHSRTVPARACFGPEDPPRPTHADCGVSSESARSVRTGNALKYNILLTSYATLPVRYVLERSVRVRFRSSMKRAHGKALTILELSDA